MVHGVALAQDSKEAASGPVEIDQRVELTASCCQMPWGPSLGYRL